MSLCQFCTLTWKPQGCFFTDFYSSYCFQWLFSSTKILCIDLENPRGTFLDFYRSYDCRCLFSSTPVKVHILYIDLETPGVLYHRFLKFLLLLLVFSSAPVNVQILYIDLETPGVLFTHFCCRWWFSSTPVKCAKFVKVNRKFVGPGTAEKNCHHYVILKNPASGFATDDAEKIIIREPYLREASVQLTS